MDESIDPLVADEPKINNLSTIARYAYALKHIPPDAMVVDAASGRGYGTAMLAKNARRVIGLEIQDEYIQYAKQHYHPSNVSYVQLDLEHGFFNGTPYIDAIVSLETIEHLKDSTAFRNSIAQSLKPGGMLVLSFPNPRTNTNNSNQYHHQVDLDELHQWIAENFSEYRLYGQGPLIGKAIDLMRGKGVSVGITENHPSLRSFVDRVPLLSQLGAYISPIGVKSSRYMYIVAKGKK